MAWLITLALFLGIGGWFCKIIDKQNDKHFEQQYAFDQKLKKIKANIYVLAWQEVLNLQIDMLHAANGYRGPETPVEYYNHTHTDTIQRESVCHAVQELRHRDQDVFRVTEKGQIVVKAKDPFVVGIDAPRLLPELPYLVGKLDSTLACEATDQAARQIAIPILNREQPNSNVVHWH